ncbi:MAG: metallopeptidase family protein [Chloroflexota bacterium]
MSLGLSRPEFEKLVASALRGIPPRFRKIMREENIVITVEGRPSRTKLLNMGMNPEIETLFGLYEGVPRTERTSGYNFAVPDKITIYQEPMEEECGNSREAIKEQVRRTVLHEIAHFFGISDPELEAMGWD